MSVLRLPLDTGDPVHRRLLEDMFSAAFSVRRALQGDARSRARAYRAAAHERATNGARSVRERLGLSREALEHRAYEHVDRAPHLRRFVTKALAMHLADSVWTSVERHLFEDASGKRQGLLHVGKWFDFARLPGRARSHTTPRKWETFRLHGTLEGHRAAYSSSDGRFFQPRRMRSVAAPTNDSWWSHSGALVLVFSGLHAGELALPVRLPAAPSNQPILDHHLSDPERWHKVDLVRRRDPNAAGGWQYEAHLMVLVKPYESPATIDRREAAARETAERSVGIDVNVSNVTIASHADGEDMRITRIARDDGDREAAKRRARKDRQRKRALERSRRAANPEQYLLSARQLAHEEKRAAAGLLPRTVIPSGPRKSRANRKPMRSFKNDRLTRTYRRARAAIAAGAAAATQAKKAHAQRVAAETILRHGFRAVVEDASLAAWSRSWGRSMAAFAPGILLAAMRREAEAVAMRAERRGGGILRASTKTTALSQHCLCGARVAKPLAARTHFCAACGLAGDRDAVAAALASFVAFESPAIPATASVSFERARTAANAIGVLRETLSWSPKGRQDAPSESNAASAPGGSCAGNTERTSRTFVAARRNAGTASCATPDEDGAKRRTTPKRARMRTGMPRRLRDSS